MKNKSIEEIKREQKMVQTDSSFQTYREAKSLSHKVVSWAVVILLGIALACCFFAES